ncbi:hypothetical protein TNCV_769971 [Trichonephila clavipes]|nr:hypothetical protein TNCV_769971 [Trichonephila clavipes]
MRAFGDSPRNFELWSRTTPELELPSPNYHTNGRTFKLSTGGAASPVVRVSDHTDSVEDFVFPKKTARPVYPSVSEPVATINSFSDLESEEIKDQDKTEVKTIEVPKPKPSEPHSS